MGTVTDAIFPVPNPIPLARNRGVVEDAKILFRTCRITTSHLLPRDAGNGKRGLFVGVYVAGFRSGGSRHFLS
jgi:hypothetical protein